MAEVRELLDRFAEIGATVRADNDQLCILAGATPVPADLIRRLRQAKTEVLAALAAAPAAPEPALDAALNPAWWRREFHVRTAHWLVSPRTVREAEMLAWGDLQEKWRRRFGRRTPSWQCAGCKLPFDGSSPVELDDDNSVHQPIKCLIAYGKRWRQESTRGLMAFGLRRPGGVDDLDDDCQVGAPHPGTGKSCRRLEHRARKSSWR